MYMPKGEAQQQVRRDLYKRAIITFAAAENCNFSGHDPIHQIMILPYSHSPGVKKPSQAMSTARHQNGGR